MRSRGLFAIFLSWELLTKKIISVTKHDDFIINYQQKNEILEWALLEQLISSVLYRQTSSE